MRIAIWNIEHLHPVAGKGAKPRTDTDYQAMAAVAARVGADVWLLQETGGVEAVERILPGRDWQIGAAPARRRDLRTNRCLQVAVAWRTGIRARTRNISPTGTWTSERHAIELTIDTIRILAVHLKAGCADGPLRAILAGHLKACPLQWLQHRAILSWLRRPGPRIAAGDFNRRLSTEIVTGRGPGARYLRGSCLVVPTTRADADDGACPNEPVDHIVLGPNAAQRWNPLPATEHAMSPSLRLSDHRPISFDYIETKQETWNPRNESDKP